MAQLKDGPTNNAGRRGDMTQEKARGRSRLPNLGEDDGEEATVMTDSLSDSAQISSSFAARPYLIVVGGTASSRVFSLGETDQVLGRGGNAAVQATIVLADQGVSRAHARITCDGDDYIVEDLKSANGTFLNGKRIEGKYRLTPGDRIRLGPTIILRFEWPTPEVDTDAGVSSGSVTSFSLRAAWSPTSWHSKVAAHMPTYAADGELERAVAALSELPPLVTSWEIHRLKTQLAEAQNGERFLLHGGDCAETFAGCTPLTITNKLKILLQMSLVLTHAARKPVIRLGRLAGQYAKPRSKPTEVKNGVELPSYLGDLVNRPEFTAAARRHDPALLVEGYKLSGMTLNFIRSLCAAGFSDLRKPGYFDLNGVFDNEEAPTGVRDEYARMKRQVSEGLHFLRAMGEQDTHDLTRVEFFTSHEALNLHYEAAQTRTVPNREGWYCLTAHLPWIGERTRLATGAHVEFLRGVTNPIGVKIGPDANPSDVVSLLRILNPDDEPGKMVLIIRMGVGKVPKKLPPIIEAVTRARRKVLWVTDPMHGNSLVTKSGIKTRNFSDILQEVEETFDTHEACGSLLGGIHFELTGEDVTECIGAGLTEADLDLRYLTACDPRLNYRQAMEMTFAIARRIATSTVRRASSRPPPL
jgi:3-deoxy-7-phosphoheptulonate synthase